MERIANDDVEVQVDARGARVASIVERRTGRELLFRAPWSIRPVAESPASNAAWVAAWPGGWDVLTPNAGACACLADRRHGFHGDASLATWTLERRTPTGLTWTWRDPDDVRVVRVIELDGPRLRVTGEVVNDGVRTVAFVWVEHLVIDGALAADPARIDMTGRVVALADAGPPADGWAAARPWPFVARAGHVEDWSHTGRTAFSRYGVVLDTGGRAAVGVPDGLRLSLTWSSETLPFLWIWHEHRAHDGLPGGARVHCLGLEPASVSTGEGIAAAHARHEAVELAPGATWACWSTLEIAAVDGMDHSP